MIKVLKIVSPDYSFSELKEFARKATEGFDCKRILVPTVDAAVGKQVEVLLLCGHENVRVESC